METILINDIVVNQRDRQDYGDLEDLSESLKLYGLIEPIVLDSVNNLIAGGRRLAAAKLLGWETILVYRRETMSEATRSILETEENIRRKAYNWREEVTAVCKIHTLHLRQAALDGTKWTMAMTGETIGYGPNYVWNCTDVVDVINTKEFESCESLTDAVKVRARQREDAAQAEIVHRMRLNQPIIPQVNNEPIVEPVVVLGQPSPPITIRLSERLFLGDCVNIMWSWPAGLVNHIVTDPPYGIDIAMMDQAASSIADVDRIKSTHNVGENQQLFQRMLPAFYHILKPTGYCIFFCDIMNWQLLYDLAIDVGFKVQRWPLVWHKLGPCKNAAAHLNFTKNHELAMVCRKAEASLWETVQTSVVECVNDAERESNPFAKPYELWRFLIEAVSKKGDTILDPFTGEGSSLITGERLLRRMIGIELDENHFNYAVDSIKKEYQKRFPNALFV